MVESLYWSHHNPVQVVAASLETLASHVSKGRHVLLVTSAGFVRRGVVDRIAVTLRQNRLTVWDGVKPNPDLRDLDAATMRLRKAGIDTVLALGGGSAMDAGKALAATLCGKVVNPLAEVFRAGNLPSWDCRLPLVTIPTTAGTGAEVTPFATVWDHEQHRKHSLAGPLMFPDVALLDASLTLTLPADETLFPGLDAVSHALESLWNRHCTPVSRALALQSLALAARALPAVLAEPGEMAHRRDMQAASLMAGMAISQTRTALAHSISYPVTTYFGVPHGLACSFTLPVLLEMNRDTLANSDAEHQLLGAVLELLRGFGLGERVRHYLQPDQLESLRDEMITPGRSDNYAGAVVNDLGLLISAALV